jgi:hypothetical protein
MKQNEKKLALSKQNLILMAICFAIILIGFLLMIGGSTGEHDFNPDIFSTRRLTVGPMISLFGFVAMIGAILWKPKKK